MKKFIFRKWKLKFAAVDERVGTFLEMKRRTLASVCFWAPVFRLASPIPPFQNFWCFSSPFFTFAVFLKNLLFLVFHKILPKWLVLNFSVTSKHPPKWESFTCKKTFRIIFLGNLLPLIFCNHHRSLGYRSLADVVWLGKWRMVSDFLVFCAAAVDITSTRGSKWVVCFEWYRNNLMEFAEIYYLQVFEAFFKSF